MFTVVAKSDQLIKAINEIKQAENNGFMYCEAIFNLKTYGENISNCVIEYETIIEKAHPTDANFNWGRGQNVSKRYKFIDGKLHKIIKDDFSY